MLAVLVLCRAAMDHIANGWVQPFPTRQHHPMRVHVMTVPLGPRIAKLLTLLSLSTAVNCGHCGKWWQWDQCSHSRTGHP